jgi:MFS family permease
VPREPLLTRPFLLAFAAHFLHALGFNLFLHLPGHLKTLGATEVAIGAIYGVGSAVAVLARPAMGTAMDRRGARLLIRGGGLLHATACALYLTVGSLGPWVYFVRIVHGVAIAMIFVSLFAFVAELLPPRRRIEGIALFGVSGMLPMSVGGLIGDVVVAQAGYRALFALAAVLATVALALSLPLRDPSPAEPGAPRPAAAPGFLAGTRGAGLVPLWLVGLVFGAAVAAPFTFLKTFVLATGIGSVGLFFTLYSLTAVALRLLANRLPDRVGPKRVLIPALATGGAGLGLLALTHTATEMAVAGVLCGLSHGFAFPILVGMLVARAPAHGRGAAYAVFTALWDVGAMLGGPLFGLVIQRAGYPPMFGAAAALILAGTATYAVLDRRRRA